MQPLQEVQSILEERGCRILTTLCDAHPRQGQVLALAGITQVLILGGQATGICPVESCLQVALCQLELRPHGGSLGHQVGREATQLGHSRQGVQGCEGCAAVATRLL